MRSRLQRLITRNAGQQLPVIFDFDNTLVCGDIGEATLAVLARSGRLAAEKLPGTLSPAFRTIEGRELTLDSVCDLTEYYDAFLAPTVHGSKDTSPLSNGYVWAVEVMEGLSVLDVVTAAREAFSLSSGSQPVLIEVSPGKTAFPAPFFYEPMVELIAQLLLHDFDVWIVSASNVWSVRWMILRALNPLLKKFGCRSGLKPERVLAVSTLLADEQRRLYKDAILVRENTGYAALEEKTLDRFVLTSRLQFPVPIYSGKVACLFEQLNRRPWLCVGDSPSDLPMLRYGEHQLWLARLEKPDYQQALAKVTKGSNSWMVQPLLTKTQPGFASNLEAPLNIVPASNEIRRSVTVLRKYLTPR